MTTQLNEEMKSMIEAIKTGLLVSAVAALAGCTSASGPDFSAWTLHRSNGETAYRVDCSGLLEGPEVCQRKSQEICGQQPVHVLEAIEPYKTGTDQKPNTRELTFECGAASVATAVSPAPGSAMNRNTTSSGNAN
ncbi:hypothetical protein [Burkholderia sp. BCC1977]|uniref:hypothetical protein n=1 Tax=Burkholderia sp. BCC1977 TaxID=2817440 RepID=UPI002ABD7E51|nr:hypothetical protein [Burkholderia sp. BCC1977]